MAQTSRLADRHNIGHGESRHFDAWLQTSLRRLYDESLDQAVPKQLLDLLPPVEDTKVED